MATLETMRTNVLSHLGREAGTTEYWDSDKVDEVINFLYKNLAEENRNVIESYTRDSVITVGKIYSLPAELLSVKEVLFNTKAKDPISIYEIRLMDDEWRERSGTPDWYCLDYKLGNLLLWYFPSTVAVIEIIGPIIPTTVISSETPKAPYSSGTILEPGAVSFLLAQEGGGQNLERANYWYNIFLGSSENLKISKTPGSDRQFRSITASRMRKFGPRYPSNYPAINWFRRR